MRASVSLLAILLFFTAADRAGRFGKFGFADGFGFGRLLRLDRARRLGLVLVRGFQLLDDAADGVVLAAVPVERIDDVADRIAADLDALRQRREVADMRERKRLHAEIFGGQPLDAIGRREHAPFGLQCRDLLALLIDLVVQPRDLLRFISGAVFDVIDHDRRRDQSAYCDQIEAAQHRQRSRRGSREVSVASGSSLRADASVRSAARSLAERARGFCSDSSSEGASGFLVSSLNVADFAFAAGAWRETEGALERAARNSFTSRSSSEWKETTTSFPPGARMRSAASSAAESSNNSSFT